uniref:Asteroid domain-containing protein n=1 Tax=Knipowitschia caucasica TaxID=637954 RepID=A0AAV2KAD1_KNICA
MFQSKTLWINTCGFCARSTLLSYADKSAFRKKTKPTAVVTSWNLNQASANSFVSMGVRGLTSFVEGNTHFLQGVKFRDSWLLIDGSSLYFQIYFHHGLDQLHGGDYDAFSCLLKQFFAALAACNIQAFVVLDGGIDPSDKKLDTLRQRLQTKIKDADNISHSRRGSVLPLLTKEVFIQVLIQIGVPLVQCPAEADWEIACLARQWNCPILSKDSDFYVFDLPGGYLPFNYFNWTNISGKTNQRYISAQLYTASVLCRWFGGLNKDLLPLCAVLLGNDYSTPKEAELKHWQKSVSSLKKIPNRVPKVGKRELCAQNYGH